MDTAICEADATEMVRTCEEDARCSVTTPMPEPDDCVLPTLAVGRTQSTYGDRTFAAAAPRLRNSLPPDLRQPGLSYGQFRRSLKTFLFGQ